MKTKTITFTHLPFYVPAGDNEPRWHVDVVTDSTEFSPGQLLTKEQVDKLCADDGWKVTIKAMKK